MRHIKYSLFGYALLVLSGIAFGLTPPPAGKPKIPEFSTPAAAPSASTVNQAQASPYIPVAPVPQTYQGNAQQSSPQTTSPVISDTSATMQLDSLRTEAAILQEQLTVTKLQADIHSARSGNKPGTPLTGYNSGSSDSLTPPNVVMLPSVKSVQGINGKLTAEIVYENGSTLKVHVGQRLSDGSIVKYIGNDGVSITTRLGVRVLPMYNPEANQASVPSTPTNTPLQTPPLPAAMQKMPPSTDSTSIGSDGGGPNG